jgi:threonine/homoserine/homoserine lactone efflux protein
MKDSEKFSRELAGMKAGLYSLAGVSLLLLTETLRRDKLDRLLAIAFYCFVISIPLLVGFAIMIESVQHRGWREIPEAVTGWFIGPWLSAYVAVTGIGAYLWHFNWIGAVTFVGSIFLATSLFISFRKAVEKAEAPKSDAEQTDGPG